MDTTTDNAKIVREMIFKESEFINNRITWLVTLQGLLFAALGFAWKDGRELIKMLGVVGFVASVSLLLPLFLAQSTIHKIKEEWDDAKKNLDIPYSGPDVVGYHPKNIWLKWVFVFWSPWVMLPVLFIVIWPIIIWINSHRPLPAETPKIENHPVTTKVTTLIETSTSPEMRPTVIPSESRQPSPPVLSGDKGETR